MTPPNSAVESNLIFIFIDGVGVGRRDEQNPFHLLDEAEASPLAIFADEPPPGLPHDGRLALTDATLGVEGRPQSASGQTTILTGVNIPRLLGYHKQGFPNASMRELLGEHSLFRRLARLGVAPLAFANAYPPQFFERPPRWRAATTIAVEAAGMTLRTLADVSAGRALHHEWSNRLRIERGEDATPLADTEAADVLARLAAENRFTLYEYFLTDAVGHARDMAAARRTLAALNRLINLVLDRIDLRRTTLVVTSDHGNVEDLSVRTHTRNPVPTLVWGARRDLIASRVRSLTDITPAIIDALTSDDAEHE